MTGQSNDSDIQPGPNSEWKQRPEENHPSSNLPFHENQRRRHGKNSGWVVGAILILAGGLLLLQNFTNFSFNNWWALFILIPSFTSFADAWNHYQEEKRLTQRARNSLIGGVIFLFIALYFLFNLSLGSYWPYLLILGGVIILLNALLPES
ncbi:MAG TPA: hypothetical protein DEQ80_02710 [Anaerolinea thermolimosa]|uniref:DUF5668 domain-containing protein n=1 Tax=Anaerolinea thermolimosa TaxID=229919 RepID=A0A3D1JDU1_9CHLR|nr:hypothetical protein [Anaerolinea thermolimosa]GAP06195.1 hypothetical protein ATHL_01042 [Anaerolinea thermolimosa]HCE16751.1 hypothetical protein [Anaerolinea thermolimosa]